MRLSLGIGELLLFLMLALAVAALVSFLRSERSLGVLQVLWLGAILLLPGVGPALYLIVRRPQLRA